jgi:hypothetical protein
MGHNGSGADRYHGRVLKEVGAAVEEAIILAAMLLIAVVVGCAVVGVSVGRRASGPGVILFVASTVAVYGLFLTMFYWRDFRRWRLRRAGCCERCGYDRRGLGAGAACPECGMAP